MQEEKKNKEEDEKTTGTVMNPNDIEKRKKCNTNHEKDNSKENLRVQGMKNSRIDSEWRKASI